MIVDPNWTEGEAAAALEQWYYDSPGSVRLLSDPSDPYDIVDPFTSPYGEWLSENYIDMLEDQYRAGDTEGVVLRALYVCMAFGRAIPLWLETEFMGNYDDATRLFKSKSWDEVWGKPHGTELKPKSQRKRLDDKEPITQLVRWLHDGGDGMAMDNALWEEVSQLLGLTQGYIRSVYYDDNIYTYKAIEYKKLCSYYIKCNSV